MVSTRGGTVDHTNDQTFQKELNMSLLSSIETHERLKSTDHAHTRSTRIMLPNEFLPQESNLYMSLEK